MNDLVGDQLRGQQSLERQVFGEGVQDANQDVRRHWQLIFGDGLAPPCGSRGIAAGCRLLRLRAVPR